jgi:pyruvate formate lyase activating enzyme
MSKHLMEDTGIVFNIQRYAIHDGPGIRTLIFFKGCPLRCLWCSNPESQEFERQVVFNSKKCCQCGRCIQVCPKGAITKSFTFGRIIDYKLCDLCGECIEICEHNALQTVGSRYTADDLVNEVLKDSIFFWKSGGGVTLSGGEPLAHENVFLVKLLQRLKEENVHVVVETGGCVYPEIWDRVLPYIDLIFFDLKVADPAKHKNLTGMDNTRILHSLKLLKERKFPIWARIAVIPGYNDSDVEIAALAKIIQDKENIQKISLLPYHAFGSYKYASLGREYALNGVERPQEQRLLAIKELFEVCLKGKTVEIGN